MASPRHWNDCRMGQMISLTMAKVLLAATASVKIVLFADWTNGHHASNGPTIRAPACGFTKISTARACYSSNGSNLSSETLASP